MMNDTKLSRSESLFLIGSAVLIMLIVSTSSPLYPFNVWDDVNVYFTVGREMLRGIVPYRNLYEQKGPLFLMLYAVSALISRKSFLGIWIFECISACFFSIMTWKTVKLCVKDLPRMAIGLVPVYVSAVFTIGMFNFGGNTEEFGISLLSMVMYIAVKMILKGKYEIPDRKEALICGITASVLFWSKYTLIGFIAAFILVIIYRAVRGKEFRKLGSDILFFLIGFLSVTLVVFIYFIANHALDSLWEVYFYNNIFKYYTDVEYMGIFGNPLFKFFVVPFLCLADSCRVNPDYCLYLILSLAGAFFFPKPYRKQVIPFFLFTFIVSMKFVFTKNTYLYYYGYILAVFFVFALILICRGYAFIVKLESHREKLVKWLSVFVMSVLMINLLYMCKNTYLLKEKKEELTVYEFGKIINETSDPKILTFDIIDGGFYLAADVSPCNRYFTYMNFIENNHEATEEQDRLISEGYFDYIITYSDVYDWEGYEMIAEGIDPMSDFTKDRFLVRYCLYQRSSSSS